MDYLPIFRRLPDFFRQRPGSVTFGKPFDAYAALPALNASLLKKPTPLQMLHEMRSPLERQDTMPESRAFAFAQGEAIHKAILEPHLFDGDKAREYFQYSPTKGLATVAARSAFAADPTKPLVTEEIMDTARRVRDAVHAHHFARRLIEAPGGKEATLEVYDPENLIMRKVRFDLLPGFIDSATGAFSGGGASFLADVKSTSGDLTKWALLSTVRKLGYHVAARWYLDTLKLLTGEDRRQFFFIFITTAEPFMCRVVELNLDLPGENLLNDAAGILYGGDYGAGRVPMFINAAREFISRVQEQHANPVGAWEGYENEEALLLDINTGGRN